MPGLVEVVHFTKVEVASVTTQDLPSIKMEYSDISGWKFVPVNVTVSPPTTVPNLGDIDVRSGVTSA